MTEDPIVQKVEQTKDGLRITLLIPADLSYFPGHFPGHPVVPGVVQLRWVDELAQKYHLSDRRFASVEKLKFQRIISRDYVVTLELTRASDTAIQFQYHSSHGQHSSGKLIFDS